MTQEQNNDFDTLDTFGVLPEQEGSGANTTDQPREANINSPITKPNLPAVPNQADGAALEEDPEVTEAFNRLAAAQQFEQTWSNKFKLRHVLIAFGVLAVIPAVITLILK